MVAVTFSKLSWTDPASRNSSSAGWQLSGFDRWIRSLRLEYQRRRDLFMRAFLRDVASTGVASADYPEAGMFVWIKVDIERHPRYRTGIQGTDGSMARTNTAQLMEELFERCLDGGLVVMPASVFATPASDKVCSVEDPIEDVSVSHFALRWSRVADCLAAEIKFLTRHLCWP